MLCTIKWQFGIKANAEDDLKHLKALWVAVDKIQEKNCTIVAAVQFTFGKYWKKTLRKKKNSLRWSWSFFSYHYNQTLDSPYFLDYLMDLHYAGINLNASEKTEYLLFAKEKYFQSVMLSEIYGKL